MIKTNKNTYFDKISQFKFFDKKRLGKGSFGEVRLALHIQTSLTYAIKIIDPKQITTQIGTRALQRQALIHSTLSHPHIVKLWQVLREDSKVYMIMEYAQKGNLFYHQNQKRVFSQQQASKFFSQTLSAIQYLHSLNLVHRDIKPQNLLLDKDYNIKLCDLGWIVQGINQNHSTFCGTYQYMAPQMIFQRQYDHRIDIWALGILLYQLLHGCAPFQGQKVEQVRKSMLEGQINIDPDLSENVQNLIFNILKVDPNQRLTIQSIKAHPWLNDMKKRRILNMPSFLVTQNQLQNILTKNQRKNKQSIKVLQQKKNQKNQSLKNIQKKALLLLHSKKSPNKHLKFNLSIQNLNFKKPSKDKAKNKDKKSFEKIFKQISSKKLTGGHKYQNSEFSQLVNLKNSRLRTQLCDGQTLNYQVIRFNTEAGQGCQALDQRSTIKKKNIMSKKNDLYSVKSSEKSKLIRKSID